MSAPRDLERIGREITAIRDRLRLAVLSLNIPHHEKEVALAALDDLTTAVGALETASAAVAAEVAVLKSSENETALEALVPRIAAVTSTLNGLVPPMLSPADPAPAQ